MKIIIIHIILFLLSLLIFSCSKKSSDKSETLCVDESIIDSEALCYEIFAPVCGCNGETYSNDCKALNNGILRYEEGECK